MTGSPLDKAQNNPTLRPLAFAIRKGIASIEAALAAPRIEAELSGILYEAETVSLASTKLATELERTARKPGMASPEPIKRNSPLDPEALARFAHYMEAALAGRICPDCGGLEPDVLPRS